MVDAGSWRSRCCEALDCDYDCNRISDEIVSLVSSDLLARTATVFKSLLLANSVCLVGFATCSLNRSKLLELDVDDGWKSCRFLFFRAYTYLVPSRLNLKFISFLIF